MEIKRDNTQLWLFNENGQYEIKIDMIEMSIPTILSTMIIPLLESAGYHRDSIAQYIEVEDAFNDSE